MAKKRSEAQLAADAEYRANNPGVLVRFSAKEIAAIDKALRKGEGRPEWIKRHALAGLPKAR